MNKIINLFVNIYCFPFYIAYNRTDKTTKNKIDLDIARYEYGKLGATIFKEINFRNVFYYRISNQKILKNICKLLLKPNPGIEIYVKDGGIGGGLRIYHAYGCVIAAEKIGENCSILQGTTIGNGKKNERTNVTNPVIGDNVSIHANAVLFGGIEIGDNVKIGANATVHVDVPSDSTVVGNSKIINDRVTK